MARRDGEIHLLSAFTEQEEALLIASRVIETMRREHARYQDFAILYRTNSQSRALEEAFRKRNLPYAVYSGNSFFERAEVKDMMAYLKLAVNVNDDESFKRVVNKPARGIGETSLRALTELARAEGKSLFKAAYSENSEAFGLKAAALGRIRTFCELINRYAAKIGVTGAHEVAVGLSDASGLYAFYKADNSIEGQSRASNVEELLNSVAQFEEDRREEYRIELAAESQDPEVPEKHLVTLPEFLEDISLLTAVDLQDEEDSANKIALMTVHSAKGLEFPYVFVTGLEENLFPPAVCWLHRRTSRRNAGFSTWRLRGPRKQCACLMRRHGCGTASTSRILRAGSSGKSTVVIWRIRCRGMGSDPRGLKADSGASVPRISARGLEDLLRNMAVPVGTLPPAVR